MFIFYGILFAREATIREVLSENMILIEQNGITKRAQLAGIALFANVNAKEKEVSYKQREDLQAKAIEYLQEFLPVGKKIKFIKIDNENRGPEYIWVSTENDKELNYLMVKNGYALLDENNPYLLGSFYIRLKRAMNYAKIKKKGLWADNFDIMEKLLEKRNYYGSSNKNVSKNDILNFFEERVKLNLRK